MATTRILRLNPKPNTCMTPAQALHSALGDLEDPDRGFQDILIIGYDQKGELYIRSSEMTCSEAMFLANKAFRWAECGGED